MYRFVDITKHSSMLTAPMIRQIFQKGPRDEEAVAFHAPESNEDDDFSQLMASRLHVGTAAGGEAPIGVQ